MTCALWQDRPRTVGENSAKTSEKSNGPVYVKVHETRPEDYDGTCLRPLGLCELGGCCDTCWYRPNHPRFKKTQERG